MTFKLNWQLIKRPGILITLGYYLLVIIFICHYYKPGDWKTGMCGPGLDLVSFFLMVIPASVLAIVCLVLILTRGKAYLPNLLINTLVIGAWFLINWYCRR